MKTIESKTSARAVSLMTLASASSLLAFAGQTHAQVASAMLREGGILPGAPAGHLVNSINTPAVNHVGGYAWEVNSSDGVTTLSHIWGHATGGAGNPLRTEGVFGIYTQTAFESFFGLSDSGAAGYGPTVTPGGDSVWVDSTPVAVETQPHPTLAGMFWTFGSRPGITASGTPYFVGGVAPTAGGATTNRGLFYGPNGGTTLILGGQLLPNLPRVLSMSVTNPSFDYRFSANGSNYIATVTMVAPTADDSVMTLNGSGLIAAGGLVQESLPIPPGAGGIAGETWVNFDYCGVANSGTYFFTGDSSLVATADEFIFKNGQMLYRDGMLLDGQTLQGDIAMAYMNENGDIAYVWDVAANTLEALYVNDNLLLKEGDTVDLDNNGIVEPNSVLVSFSGIAALVVSDRAANGVVRVFFTAEIDIAGTSSTLDDVEGAFAMTVDLTPCTADIDGGGSVEINDLLEVINNWGPCLPPCPPSCAADIDGNDCQVNINDLLAVINTWGPCP